MTLRNKFLGRPSNSIKEEIDNIEDVKWEVKGAKMLQDLSYEKNDEIVEIAKIELKLQRSGIQKNQLIFLKIQLFQKNIYILFYR